jgi:hypothetical protein
MTAWLIALGWARSRSPDGDPGRVPDLIGGQ